MHAHFFSFSLSFPAYLPHIHTLSLPVCSLPLSLFCTHTLSPPSLSLELASLIILSVQLSQFLSHRLSSSNSPFLFLCLCKCLSLIHTHSFSRSMWHLTLCTNTFSRGSHLSFTFPALSHTQALLKKKTSKLPCFHWIQLAVFWGDGWHRTHSCFQVVLFIINYCVRARWNISGCFFSILRHEHHFFVLCCQVKSSYTCQFLNNRLNLGTG